MLDKFNGSIHCCNVIHNDAPFPLSKFFIVVGSHFLHCFKEAESFHMQPSSQTFNRQSTFTYQLFSSTDVHAINASAIYLQCLMNAGVGASSCLRFQACCCALPTVKGSWDSHTGAHGKGCACLSRLSLTVSF